MKAITFRVTNFRCFVDSGWVRFTPGQPLILVGKNEAGKSALLAALSQLTASEVNFEPVRDWPRSKRQADREATAAVVEVKFQLEPHEINAIRAVDPTAKDLRTFSVRRGYDGFRRYAFDDLSDVPPVHNHRAVLQMVAANEALDESVRELATTLAQSPSLPERTAASIDALLAALPDKSEQHARVQGLQRQLSVIWSRTRLLNWIDERLPTFHYFNSYDLISGPD